MGNANETMTPPPSPEVTTKKLKLMDLQVRLDKSLMVPSDRGHSLLNTPVGFESFRQVLYDRGN